MSNFLTALFFGRKIMNEFFNIFFLRLKNKDYLNLSLQR